ncbi:MAG: DUF3137 domain-containing protein [Planctomycetes bacterium]|nr:DUF3137 domain-containing protein [Planctomycetota bacterium]
MGKLLDWFGPSRTEIWRKLSAQIGGAYTPGTWRRTDRITVEVAHWTVTLDTYTVHANNTHVPYTRFRAPFLNTDQWRFKVYRSNLFTAIGKWFGMQDVEVGSLQFDADFVVKTNDERKARAFCADAELRRMLMAQKSVTLSVEDHEGWFGPKFPADTDELRVVVGGHLKDTERLRALFLLFGKALDRLCAIGAAYEEKPSLRL